MHVGQSNNRSRRNAQSGLDFNIWLGRERIVPKMHCFFGQKRMVLPLAIDYFLKFFPRNFSDCRHIEAMKEAKHKNTLVSDINT